MVYRSRHSGLKYIASQRLMGRGWEAELARLPQNTIFLFLFFEFAWWYKMGPVLQLKPQHCCKYGAVCNEAGSIGSGIERDRALGPGSHRGTSHTWGPTSLVGPMVVTYKHGSLCNKVRWDLLPSGPPVLVEGGNQFSLGHEIFQGLNRLIMTPWERFWAPKREKW